LRGEEGTKNPVGTRAFGQDGEDILGFAQFLPGRLGPIASDEDQAAGSRELIHSETHSPGEAGKRRSENDEDVGVPWGVGPENSEAMGIVLRREQGLQIDDREVVAAAIDRVEMETATEAGPERPHRHASLVATPLGKAAGDSMKGPENHAYLPASAKLKPKDSIAKGTSVKMFPTTDSA